MYEIFEHTADIGLRIRAADLGQLYAEAGRALFSVIVANPEAIRPIRQIPLAVDAPRPDDLLHDWLAELLFTFDTQHVLLWEFDVEVRDSGLTATARGEPMDAHRHVLAMEVKAITYHGLRLEPADGGWLAEVIVDI